MSDDPGAAVMAVKPETFLGHWRDMRDAKDEAGSAATEVARRKKAAKRAGIDLDVVKLVEKLSDLEDDERQSFLSKVETYCGWLKLPLGAFSAGITIEEPKASSREAFSRWQAGQDGHESGLNGAPKEANPHRNGSPEAQEWAKKWKVGFDANQRKIAAKMAKGTGAPRKGANKPSAAVTGKMAAAGEGLPQSIN